MVERKAVKGLESFAEMDAAVDNFEALCSVRVVDEGVRGHFATAVGPRPLLGRAHQCPADSLPAILLRHEPSLDEPHRTGRIAPVGVGTEAGFKKSDQSPGCIFGNQHDDRKTGLTDVDQAGFEF